MPVLLHEANVGQVSVSGHKQIQSRLPARQIPEKTISYFRRIIHGYVWRVGASLADPKRLECG